MAFVLFTFIVLFFSYKIFTSKGSNRVLWYVVGILFFHEGIILISNPIDLSAPRIFTLSLLLSSIFCESQSEWRSFPLKKIFLFILISLIIIGFNDTRLSSFQLIYRPAVYFFDNFLPCILAFLSFKEEKDWKKTMKVLYSSMIIMCLYGLATYLIRFNHYNDLIAKTTGWLDTSSNINLGTSRERVSSFTNNSIYYGYMISIIFIIFIVNFVSTKTKNIHHSISFIFISILMLSNLYLSNSRTPYFTFAIGLSIALFLVSGMKDKFKYFLYVLLFFIVVMNTSVGQNAVQKVTDIFAQEQNEGGSSIEMRLDQLNASLEIFDHNIYTGNGFKYIIEDLGFKSIGGDENEDLYGFESYIFELLIEQGIIGFVYSIIFFVSIILWFFMNYNRNRNTKIISGLSISLILCLLSFSVATGRLYSWPITLVLIGINMKRIILVKKEEDAEDYSLEESPIQSQVIE
jgi:Lipid A core - O-antigen ligase and related enzymes